MQAVRVLRQTNNLGFQRLDISLGQLETPEYNAVRAAFRVQPVGSAGIFVRDDHRKAAIFLQHGLCPV